MKPIAPGLIALLSTTYTLHAAPSIVTDLAPVHGLVQTVLGDTGQADVLLGVGDDPHHFALKPSQASNLQNADVVFFVSHDLTPWIETPLSNLSSDASIIELGNLEGNVQLPFREDVRFEAHDHDAHDEHEGHDHDNHGHDHEDEHNHEEHHAHDHGHDHGDNDPHTWLNPDNAKLWINTIATELSMHNPENASVYQENAQDAVNKIDVAVSEVSARLEGLDPKFIVLHDSLQHFETYFNIEALGAIEASDGETPGPARIRDVETLINELQPDCFLKEPQHNADIVEALTGGAVKIIEVDPVGREITADADYYPNLINTLAGKLEECAAK